MMKKILKITGLIVLVGVLGAFVFVFLKVRQFDASLARTYDIPLPAIARSADPAVVARGKHLAESVAGCATGDCHGTAFSGGRLMEMGPIGTMQGPNITMGGLGRDYSDGEIARAVVHGVKRDGHSLIFMPAHEINWMPDEDIAAIVSYLRTVPASSNSTAGVQLTMLAKVLDTTDVFIADIARRIDHEHRRTAPTPTPTAAYGEFLAKGCQGCHGQHLSGGPIPGAPPSMPVPRNLTPDATGLKGWSYTDFERVLNTGTRPDGKPLDKFMPYEAYGKMNDLEKHALWAYLQSLPATTFGSR